MGGVGDRIAEGMGAEVGKVEEEVRRGAGRLLWLRMRVGEIKWGGRVIQNPNECMSKLSSFMSWR